METNALYNPYSKLSGGQWLKGNFHTHSTRSDGDHSPQVLVNAYAQMGHHFMMFSDHDTLIDQAELDQLDNKGMLLLAGNEVSANGTHILHLNAREQVAPSADRQLVFDAIAASGDSLAVCCHPNWQKDDDWEHISIDQLMRWQNYQAIEIYNGVVGKSNGSPYAVNKWDWLLSHGKRIWGMASDDCHESEDIGLGWNWIYVQEPTVAGIITALRKGHFYASTGVVVHDVTISNGRIRIETENARRIVALRQSGRRFAQADSNYLEAEIPAKASYVRFECWGNGEQFAWTQPVLLSADLNSNIG